jgi:aspartyl-tRNA(Asn)/glutamyl-tRNA(Gln) amidotransferase subunit C
MQLPRGLKLSYNNSMKIDINHVAKLANLPLNPQEKEKFEKQLSETLTYVGKLSSVNTEKVKETSQVTGLENVTRVDEAKTSLTQEEALKNTNSSHNGLFKVKAILE